MYWNVWKVNQLTPELRRLCDGLEVEWLWQAAPLLAINWTFSNTLTDLKCTFFLTWWKNVPLWMHNQVRELLRRAIQYEVLAWHEMKQGEARYHPSDERFIDCKRNEARSYCKPMGHMPKNRDTYCGWTRRAVSKHNWVTNSCIDQLGDKVYRCTCPIKCFLWLVNSGMICFTLSEVEPS